MYLELTRQVEREDIAVFPRVEADFDGFACVELRSRFCSLELNRIDPGRRGGSRSTGQIRTHLDKGKIGLGRGRARVALPGLGQFYIVGFGRLAAEGLDKMDDQARGGVDLIGAQIRRQRVACAGLDGDEAEARDQGVAWNVNDVAGGDVGLNTSDRGRLQAQSQAILSVVGSLCVKVALGWMHPRSLWQVRTHRGPVIGSTFETRVPEQIATGESGYFPSVTRLWWVHLDDADVIQPQRSDVIEIEGQDAVLGARRIRWENPLEVTPLAADFHLVEERGGAVRNGGGRVGRPLGGDHGRSHPLLAGPAREAVPFSRLDGDQAGLRDRGVTVARTTGERGAFQLGRKAAGHAHVL